MKFLNYKKSYLSSFAVDEFRVQLNSIFNEELLFGLMSNSGELTNSTFKIHGLRSVTAGWSLFPVVLGKYREDEQGTLVELEITLGLFSYLMEGFALLLISLLIFSSDTTINGESSTLADRLTFGAIFISVWTFFIGLFTIVAVNITKYRTEASLRLTAIKMKLDA